MTTKVTPKKRIVISYENLPETLKDLFKERYPLGYYDYMIRVDKPSGDFFYGVVLETQETSYLVKVKVKIDQSAAEELEKDIFEAGET
ncbi:MAG: hypothetical protein RR931_06665, partial [Mucinivorans sp.]